jgi:[acyl-carrier-protein] S-malonyltransferase
MQESIPVGKGAMAAILGLDINHVDSLAKQGCQNNVCEIANDNSPGQVVISGHTPAVKRTMELASKAGAKRSILLPVSAPFHCKLMQPAAKVMAHALDAIDLQEPLVPVVANITADYETSPEKIKQLLINQVTGRVRWRESILAMKSKGLTQIVEVGAGKILTSITKRINQDLSSMSVSSPKDIENFLKII